MRPLFEKRIQLLLIHVVRTVMLVRNKPRHCLDPQEKPLARGNALRVRKNQKRKEPTKMPEPKRKRKPVTTWRAFTQRAVGASLFRPKPPAASADNSRIESDSTSRTPQVCTGKTLCSNPACPLCRRLAFQHGK